MFVAMKTLLIGQAPASYSATDARAFSGRSGARLAALMGISQSSMLRRFETANLLPRYPGKNGKGDLFPQGQARALAADFALPERALFVGAGVARAFGFAAPPFRWRPFRQGVAAWMPHPSGVNRWWNEPANVAAAARFLRRLAAAEALRPGRRRRCGTSSPAAQPGRGAPTAARTSRSG